MRFVDRKAALNMMLVNTIVLVSVGLIILTLNKRRRRMGVHRRTFTILDRIPAQIKNMSYLCEVSDADCRDQLRMDRASFHKLCFILQSVCGLKSSRRVCVSEKVAMFLSILSHHTKNRCVKFAFKRSGETVSKHFHAVLNSVLRLHAMFLVRPQPITDDNTDPRWHQFQADPHVKGLRYKTWPYYPQWVEVFGKDRATSENAVDPIDLINELYRTGLDHEGDTGGKYVSLTPEYMNDTDDDAGDKHVDLTPKAFTRGKKRKSNDSDITMLVDFLGEFMKFSKSAMIDLCSGAEKGSTSTNDTKQLNCIMKEIMGLKLSDKLKVCDELVQNSNRLELFLSLPLEEQEEYVWMLLDGRL
ncbi:hypothetical protein ACS0TY_034495 [Phlomoides rotata]